MICPVCGKKNVLGVESCAKCGVTLRVVAEPLSFAGSQVIDMGVLEENEQRGEKEERPKPDEKSNIHSHARSKQKTDR